MGSLGGIGFPCWLVEAVDKADEKKKEEGKKEEGRKKRGSWKKILGRGILARLRSEEPFFCRLARGHYEDTSIFLSHAICAVCPAPGEPRISHSTDEVTSVTRRSLAFQLLQISLDCGAAMHPVGRLPVGSTLCFHGCLGIVCIPQSRNSSPPLETSSSVRLSVTIRTITTTKQNIQATL